MTQETKKKEDETAQDESVEQSKKSKKKARRNRDKRKSQMMTYFFVVLLGFTGVIHWGFPVAVMFVYTLAGVNKKRDDYSPLEFADTVYYLGFTYTLIMLAWALGAENISTVSAFSYFGTAVITSVVGIVIRSMIQLFYRTPDENIEAANYRIQETVDKFVANLDKLNGTVAAGLEKTEKDFSTRVDKLSDSSASVNKKIEKFLEKFEGEFNAFADAKFKEVKTATDSMVSHVGEIGKLNTDVQDLLSQQLTSMSDEISDFLSRSRVNIEKLEERHGEVAEAFLTEVTALQDKVADSINGLSEQLSSQTTELDLDLSGLSDKLENMSENITRVTEGIGMFTEEESSLVALTEGFDKLDDTINNTRSSLDETYMSLVSLTNLIREQFGQVKKDANVIMSEVEDVLKDRVDNRIG